jgi:hypothetical protein
MQLHFPRRKSLKASASAGRHRHGLDAESTTVSPLGCRRHDHPSAPILILPCVVALAARSGSGWGSPSTQRRAARNLQQIPGVVQSMGSSLSNWRPSSCRPWDTTLFSLSDVLRACCYIRGPLLLHTSASTATMDGHLGCKVCASATINSNIDDAYEERQHYWRSAPVLP